MAPWLSRALAALPILASGAHALIESVAMRGVPLMPKVPLKNSAVHSPNGDVFDLSTVYYFDQQVDHNDASKGTFQQRYWTSNQYYQTGGPVVLMTPGEANADGYQGYLEDGTITGVIAQQNNGAGVIIEHRFFGLSNPIDNLNDSSLALLTIDQAVNDLVYFSQNVVLPWTGGDQVKAPQTPWILVGGSYSGALTAWTMVNKPGAFFAGWASSAVVEAITDFWGYFAPIQENMPANCSADVQAVISYLDDAHDNNNAANLANIKNAFNLGSLADVDFASSLMSPIYSWQDLQPSSGAGQPFFQFCDALEVKDGQSADANGWGVDNAIAAWGKYYQSQQQGPLCGNASAEECFGTADKTQQFFTDVDVDNAGRSWSWMVCNEVGWYQDGPPSGQPAIVSRMINTQYSEGLCTSMFPTVFTSERDPAVDKTDSTYQGWNLQVDNLFFATGKSDPWREATVSASTSPAKTSDNMPIAEGDGFHCSDLTMDSGSVDQTINAVQTQGLAAIKAWLAAK
ncbi:peptidase S28 [Coniophora puteana RWD-64-598 SS2]|uniref:Peptidase S28 n=1 Tax=Coniophora puteana (strain RWD-64-598) TaxID=741705 RepID=A0A5M3MIM6_CONPW|nr:peptidase S28 [Coniophora puteana RWD-64-598 SS2]EIW78770.1 peptidase S28 [Coniophora puteana RWD-64-598 SS2]